MWFLNQTPSRACGHFRFRSCIRSFTYWLSDYSYRHGTCFRHYLLSNKIYFPSMILHMLWNGLVSITVFF